MTTEDHQLAVSFLKNQIFLGHYVGRHRVDEIGDFRDVITLHSTEEGLQRHIDTLLTAFQRHKTDVWIAFSDSSNNGAYSLWVQLEGIAFGHYWFQIKHVRLTTKELFCIVTVLRSVPAQLVNPSFTFSQGFECAMRALRGVGNGPAESKSTADHNESSSASPQTASNRRQENQQSKSESPRNNTQPANNSQENRSSTGNNPMNDIRPFSFLKDLRGATFKQFKDRFSNEEMGVGLLKMFLLCIFFTIIGAMNLLYECLIILTNFVVVTGDVTIKGLHAISHLIESVAPIFLGVLNLVGKLATGLYILVAMMCGCTPYIPQQPRGPPPKRQALMYR